MTDIDITPESVRAHAAWLVTRGWCAVAGRLRTEADNLEREQADEKRIDELTQVFNRAFVHQYGPGATEWESMSEGAKLACYAGIRAVIVELEQDDLITDPLEAAEYQEKVLGITQEQCAAEARAEENQWDRWQYVPDGVKYRSRDHHLGEFWWYNENGIRYSDNECGHPRKSKTLEVSMVEKAPFVRVDGHE